MGHDSLGTVQLFLQFAEAEVGEAESRAQKSEAVAVSDRPSCQSFRQMDVCRQRFGRGCTHTVWGSVGGTGDPRDKGQPELWQGRLEHSEAASSLMYPFLEVEDSLASPWRLFRSR